MDKAVRMLVGLKNAALWAIGAALLIGGAAVSGALIRLYLFVEFGR